MIEYGQITVTKILLGKDSGASKLSWNLVNLLNDKIVIDPNVQLADSSQSYYYSQNKILSNYTYFLYIYFNTSMSFSMM